MASTEKIDLQALAKLVVEELKVSNAAAIAGSQIQIGEIASNCCEGHCPCDSRNGGQCPCASKCGCDGKIALRDDFDMV